MSTTASLACQALITRSATYVTVSAIGTNDDAANPQNLRRSEQISYGVLFGTAWL
jgi:hypothetical protein